MKNILIAEDEEAIRDFVVINLKRAGYKVTDVDNGLDAITAYDNAEEPFDVVILDVMMPGLDGFSVCKKLRERSFDAGHCDAHRQKPGDGQGQRPDARCRRLYHQAVFPF